MPVQTLQDVQAEGHKLYAICRHDGCRHQKEIEVDRLVQRIGPRHSLVPIRGELHFTDKMRCPSCKRRGVYLWMEPSPPKRAKAPSKPAEKEPNYVVYDLGRVPNTGQVSIATAENLFVAKAAWVSAALFYKDRRIVMRHGALVVADSRDGTPIEFMDRDTLLKHGTG